MENQKIDVSNLSINPLKYPPLFLKRYFNITSLSKKELRKKLFIQGFGYPAKYIIEKEHVKINDIVFNKLGMEHVRKCINEWNMQVNVDITEVEQLKLDKQNALISHATFILISDKLIEEKKFNNLIEMFMKTSNIELPKKYLDLHNFYLSIKNIIIGDKNENK